MRRQSILLLEASLAALASPALCFSPGGDGTRIRPPAVEQELLRPTKRRPQRLARQDPFNLLPRQHTSFLHSSSSDNVSSENEEDNDNENSAFADTCWSPKLRKVMGGLAAFGALETAYLTVTELQGNVPALLCSTTEQAASAGSLASSSSCSSVLTGPYAQIPGTEIPLAALGLVAYSTTLALAVGPLLNSSNNKDNDDTTNRVLLTAATTTMGVFSVFLMSLLFGVLHQPCPYCVASAVCSILLAKLAWIGGALPSQEAKRGIQLSAAGGLLSFAAALALFVTNYDPPEPVLARIGNRASQSLLASAAPRPVGSSSTDAAGSNNINLPPYAPPQITTTSSPEALQLADDLKSLDASFYGAFWCSHCFDQKQSLGQQAMAKIPYVECSRDGLNANTALCKSKNVPGYPTWEIAGRLYPGEQALEELQEIVTKAKAGRLQ